MKKPKISFVFAILFLIMFSNCILFTGSGSLNPPSWIHGTWYDSSENYRIDFTYDNVIVTIAGAETDYRESIEYAKSNGENPYVTETVRSTKYSFTISWDDGFVDSNTFEKIDSGTIWWTIEGIANGVELKKY